jgi:hypothetical protein
LMSLTQEENKQLSTVISEEDCNALERAYYELSGIKNMLRDREFIDAINNTILADRLIAARVNAETEYNMVWRHISNKYFNGQHTNVPKDCNFRTRIVSVQMREDHE